MKSYTLNNISQQKYLFFTGKGGVGKTSIACATAISLADSGENVLLISTDPASNLQDVFEQNISQHGTKIKDVPRLTVVNLDPVEAAEEYKESVVAPYRGQLPESAIKNMEEQLSGSCTVEIAAFNQFSDFLTDEDEARHYDHIIFDTAPTGHTLRMLQLPSAWSSFIKTSKHGASCLGQLSGLEERKDVYKQAVMNLADGSKTRLVLVSRPEEAPLKEAARSSYELRQLGICNQLLVINGLIQHKDSDDALASSIYTLQQEALAKMPEELKEYDVVQVPLRSYNLSNIKNVRKLLTADETIEVSVPAADLKRL
jgi:arsenite-transporting ATPase